MPNSYVTAASALETITTPTIITSPLDQNVSGILNADGTISLISAVYGLSSVGVTLTNNSTIAITGSFNYDTQNSISQTIFPFPSLYGIDLRSSTALLANNGTILGETKGYISEKFYQTVSNSLDVSIGTETILSFSPRYFAAGAYINSGRILNASTGFIGGISDAIYVAGNANITNQGKIEGLFFTLGNSTETVITGSITTTSTFPGGNALGSGIFLGTSSLASSNTVDNSGTISGQAGIYIDYGNVYITNQAGGLIEGNPQGSTASISGFFINSFGINQATQQGQTYATIAIVNAGTIEANGSYSGGPSVQGEIGISLNYGHVTNKVGGVIFGHYDGVYQANNFFGGTSTNYLYVFNQGLIEANGSQARPNTFFPVTGIGVSLDGGNVTNAAGGIISGYNEGVGVNLNVGYIGPITVYNSGSIIQTGSTLNSYTSGIYLADGGNVYNSLTGTISGENGIYITGYNASYIDNAGSIAGANYGIVLNSGGSINNSGHIAGAGAGVLALGEVTVTNSGAIQATATTLFINGATGFASGMALLDGGIVDNMASGLIAASLGDIFLSGGTLINAGMIIGSLGTAAYFEGNGDELIIDPGAVFSGIVYDAAGNGSLDLASATTAGTLSGLGAQFAGFSSITVATGATWTLTGANTLAAGQTLTDYGALSIGGNFANNGLLEVDPATVTFTGDLTGTGSIIIGPDSEIIFDGSVSSGETIVFQDNTGTIAVNDPAAFHAAIIGDGTVIMACFAAGTRILTAAGALTPVEDLREGDELELFDGTVSPIIWIGKRTLDLARHNQPELEMPVLISRGIFGRGLPWRDLYLSPDHALYLDGHLIPAKTLINGVTIRQVARPSITYYHSELARHAVLFAEGTAAETYLETGNRGAFENGGAPVLLHPDFAQSLREAQGCAPFAEAGPIVEAIRQRILDRSGIETTRDHAMLIRYQQGAAIIESRSAIPGYIFHDPTDRRQLGIKIAALQIAGRKIPLDHKDLQEGWHAPEPDGRWTNGHAVIPASLCQGANVEITIAASLSYPVLPQYRKRAG